MESKEYSQEYRPISLIHGIQRIFSKILAIRLQPKIAKLVDTTQTGFVKNRQITEGFIYAQHILHHTYQQKIPIAIFKADIHKAFDTVSWDYMLKVMKNLNFSQTWITWIKNLVLIGTSQILINGLLGKKLILR